MHPIDDLYDAFAPEHPAVVYGLPTAVGAGLLAVTAKPVPFLAILAGTALSAALSVAYEHTDLSKESVDGEESTADRVALAVFALFVVAVVVVGELDAVSFGVSLVDALGVITGLLAGASMVEWLLPAGRARFG